MLSNTSTNDPTDDTDKSITLKEFLVKQREQELEAADALPFKFDKCSAEYGPLRQNLHICRNCPNSDGATPRAFCYACAVTCHNFNPDDDASDLTKDTPAQHTVEEIWARRNFLCDCPSTGHCKLLPSLNTQFKTHNNSYHQIHNFSGKYCYCNEAGWAAGDRTMYQCEVCEDWFHDDCVAKDHQTDDLKIPDEDSFADFICRGCVSKHNDLFSKLPSSPLIFSVPPNTPAAPLFLKEGWRECFISQIQYKTAELFHLFQEEESLYEPEIDSDARESLYDRTDVIL